MGNEKKYNHAFTIAFQLESDNDGKDVTENEIITALEKRIASIVKFDEVLESVGLPFDTYKN